MDSTRKSSMNICLFFSFLNNLNKKLFTKWPRQMCCKVNFKSNFHICFTMAKLYYKPLGLINTHVSSLAQ